MMRTLRYERYQWRTRSSTKYHIRSGVVSPLRSRSADEQIVLQAEIGALADTALQSKDQQLIDLPRCKRIADCSGYYQL